MTPSCNYFNNIQQNLYNNDTECTSKGFIDYYSFIHLFWTYLMTLIFIGLKLNKTFIIVFIFLVTILFEIIENSKWGRLMYRKNENKNNQYKGDSSQNIIGDIIFGLIGIYLAFKIKKNITKYGFLIFLLLYIHIIDKNAFLIGFDVFMKYVNHVFFY